MSFPPTTAPGTNKIVIELQCLIDFPGEQNTVIPARKVWLIQK